MSLKAFIGTALLIAALVIAGSPTILGAVDNATAKQTSRKMRHPKAKSPARGEFYLSMEQLRSEQYPTAAADTEPHETLILGNSIYDDKGDTGEVEYTSTAAVDTTGRLVSGNSRLKTVGADTSSAQAGSSSKSSTATSTQSG